MNKTAFNRELWQTHDLKAMAARYSEKDFETRMARMNKSLEKPTSKVNKELAKLETQHNAELEALTSSQSSG